MSPAGASRAPTRLGQTAAMATVLAVVSGCSGSTSDERAGHPDTANDSGVCTPPAGTQRGVAMGTAYATSMTADAENAYWEDYGLGAVVKAPLAGGAAVTVTTPGDFDGTAMPLAVNSTEVFWVNHLGFHRAPLAGGPTEIVPFEGNSGLFVDDRTAYYTKSRGLATDAGPFSELDVMDLATRAVARIVPNRWALSLVVAGTDVFGATCVPNGVWRVSVGGGAVTTLVADTACPMQLVAANGSLYFGDSDQLVGYFFKRLRCVGEKAETLATLKGFFQFAIDGSFGYILDHGDGGGAAIVRVPLDGGAPKTLATPRNESNGIAVRGDAVYWLEGSSGADGGSPTVVRSVPK